MKFKKFLSAMFVTVAMATPVLAGCQKGGNSTSADPGTSTSVEPGPGPVQNEYVIAVEGNARVGEKVTFVLKKGNSPATLEVTFSLKNAADSEYLAFEDGAVAECKKEGKVTVVAKKADGTVVAELEVTIEKSSVLTIKEALTEAIKEAPCNGSAGKNAAQTASSFTFAGRIVAIPKSGNSDASKYDGTILIDDGEEIVAVLVYGDAAKLTAKVGDSVQLTAKFTNYYGILEAIHPSSIAGEKQSSFYPDQLTVIDRKFTAQKTQLMDADGFKAYYAEAKANGTSGATKYTSIKPVKLQKVEETGETGSNYKTFKVNGDTSECNGKLSITDTLACEAENEQGKFSNIEGYMVGGNSSSKYLKMTITKQENVAPEKAKITCASGELVVGPGSKLQLMLDLQPAGSAVKGVKWYSLNEAIATVDEDTGLVTGVSVGYVGIRAVVDGMMFPVFTMLRVDNNPAVEVKLNKTEINLINLDGQSETLTATAIGKKPTSPCGEEVVWESNNENVAKVENGKVTPVGPGQAIITARAGYAHATCVVNVRAQTMMDLEDAKSNDPVNIYGICIGAYTPGYWIADGERAFYVYSKPTTVTGGTLKVGDIVNVKGKIGFYNNCKQIANSTGVIVNDYKGAIATPKVLNITKDNYAALGAAEQCRLAEVKGVVSAAPTSAVAYGKTYNYKLKLASNIEMVAYLDGKNMSETDFNAMQGALAYGKLATVRGFVSIYSGAYQLINPSVVKVEDVTIKSLALDKTSAEVKKGGQLQLNAVFDPEYAVATPTWSVEGNDKVTVDNKGLVKVASDAVANSTATVKAKLGDLTATCTIKVIKKDPILKVDMITPTMISQAGGSSSTGYKAFTLNAPTSDAIYSGNTANGNASIQLNSNGSPANRGICTTKSGGVAAKVRVKFNKSTANNKTLNIYGKTTAYAGYTDLSSNKGTLVGSLKYDGSQTEYEYEFAGEYQYIALFSAGNALYFDWIEITWDIA